MSNALEITFDLLTKTHNEAAVVALIAAFDSPHQQIQHRALAALLNRRSSQGHREILSRLQNYDECQRQIIGENHGRLSQAIRDAILGVDQQLCDNGYLAILEFKEFDLIPTLISASADASYVHANRAAATLVKLSELLYEDLNHSSELPYSQNPMVVRKSATTALDKSVSEFAKHQRVEILQSFCILTKRQNATLKQILKNPFDKAFLPLIDILNHSQHASIMQLVLSYLDDSKAPMSVLNALAHRCDKTFLKYLMKKIGSEPTAIGKANLKQIKNIAWALEDQQALDQLDSTEQYSAMQMVNASGMPRLDVFQVIEYLLSHGKPGGRRAASAALAEFSGGKANDLCQIAMKDADPLVKANAVGQIRKRGTPNALSTLIAMIDSPHAEVRQAARESLSEYSFDRYFASFDTMEDNLRKTTGLLVKKIDINTIPRIISELKNPSRSRRLRTLEIAEVIDAISELESTLIAQLADDDHIIRAECARLLAQCNSPEAASALRELLWDKSVVVQEAAERSLDELSKPLEERPVEVDEAAIATTTAADEKIFSEKDFNKKEQS